MSPTRSLLLSAGLALLAGCGSMHDQHHGGGMHDAMHAAPATVRDGALVSAEGMSLYTFDRDPADASKSACNGQCAMNWPPLIAPASVMAHGDWQQISRDDGSRQWAYKGKPLYRWAKDQKPGDRSGDGAMGVWHLARP